MIERVEILPYHTLGVHKYEAMNLEYQLKDVNAILPNNWKRQKPCSTNISRLFTSINEKNHSLHAVLGEYCHL